MTEIITKPNTTVEEKALAIEWSAYNTLHASDGKLRGESQKATLDQILGLRKSDPASFNQVLIQLGKDSALNPKLPAFRVEKDEHGNLLNLWFSPGKEDKTGKGTVGFGF